MLLPKTSFQTVVWLKGNLEKDVDDLKERRLNSVCAIPQDSYRTTTALIECCRERIRRVDNFRRRHRENAAVKFFDWIAIWSRFLGTDQVAQHESQLEDCGRAVKLATETIEALSIAHERRRIFNSTEHDGLAGVADGQRWKEAEIIQRDVQCQGRLRIAWQQSRSQSYLRRMRRAGVDLAALRQLARNILLPNNPNSTSTISTSSSPEPLHNGGYPRHPHQPDQPFRMPSSEPLPGVHVLPQNHERGPSPYYPYARNPPTKVQSPSQLPVSLSESGPSLNYSYGPHQPARARSPSQFPRIVDLRERESKVFPTDAEDGHPPGRLNDHLASKRTKSQHQNPDAGRNLRQPSISTFGNEPAQDYVPRERGSTSANRGRDLPTVSDHGMVMNERQSHPPQRAGHNQAPTYVIIEPRQPSGSRGRRHSRSRGSNNKEAEYQSPERESSPTPRRKSPHHRSSHHKSSHHKSSHHKSSHGKSSHSNTTYVDEPYTHRHPQTNNNTHPQSSNSYDLRQTERRKGTSRIRSVSPEDEQHTRRKTSRSRSSSLNHEDHQQTERGRRTSTSSSRPLSTSHDHHQPTERGRRTSTSSSRPSSTSHDHHQQTERGRRTSSSRSSYDSGIYVTTSSSRYTASDRPLPREPNLNRATRPPISMPQRTSRRTSSTSSYDSGVFMSNTASYMLRSGSADQNFAPESPMPRQSNILHSYPPSSYYFDEDRPRRRRRSSKNR